MKSFSYILVLALAVWTGAAFSAEYDDDPSVPEPFRGHTPGSPFKINYSDWNAILQGTVVEMKFPDRDYAPTPNQPMGTRIFRGNTSSLRNEGNRIAFPVFKGDNLETVKLIRQDLEKIPGTLPMRNWTKKEKLAYWLNLYNITTIELLAEEYPVRHLRQELYGKGAIKDRKVLNVAGVALSLNDIQHIILPGGWDSSLVIYGLFQGYVGGPSIQKEAFTAQNVHRLLVTAAKEFVNSNRGMAPQDNTLKISTYYKENKVFFPNWKEDLKKHFLSLSAPEMRDRVASARHIRATSKDYYIADLFGGGRRRANSTNTNLAAFDSAILTSSTGQNSVMTYNYEFPSAAIFNRFPPHVLEYVTKMKKSNKLREGQVFLEEVESVSSEDRISEDQ